MTNDFIKAVKRSPRRFVKISTNFISAVFAGFPIAMFFALIWKGPTYLDWENSTIKWVIYTAFVVLVLFFFYRLGIKFSFDQEEQQNFHDNFYAGILASIIIALMVIFKDLIKANTWMPVIMITAIVILFFLFEYFLLKSKRPH